MKKIFFIIFLFFANTMFVSADSDFKDDYTFIDCVSGDNDIGVAFDSSFPYATLKSGIESTIDYINTNVNIVGNEESASGQLFKIKINCSFNDILNKNINLNFNGEQFNNELIIEGIDNDSFIIKDISFRLGHKSGNIIFKNASFLNENTPYFYDQILSPGGMHQPRNHPLSNGIKIINSYIQLKNGNNIGDNTHYESYHYRYNKRLYNDSLYNYSNKQFIENSIIDIELNNNYDFRMPVFIKNSKINFKNKTSTGIYNINFLEDGNIYSSSNLNYSVLVSNEIDLGGNNFSSENTNNITFLNNRFLNFKDFNFGGVGIYINNLIENNLNIDISNFNNLYNNLLKANFTDTSDTLNLRKNYSSNDIVGKGLGWVYNRIRDNNYFNININSADLYKEITGNELENGLGDIYVIFNY